MRDWLWWREQVVADIESIFMFHADELIDTGEVSVEWSRYVGWRRSQWTDD